MCVNNSGKIYIFYDWQSYSLYRKSKVELNVSETAKKPHTNADKVFSLPSPKNDFFKAVDFKCQSVVNIVYEKGEKKEYFIQKLLILAIGYFL